MQLALIFSILAFAAGDGRVEILKVYDPFGRVGPEQPGFCEVEPGTRQTIQKYLQARVSAICQMPRSDTDFFVVADVPKFNTDTDYGWRVLFVRRSDGGFATSWHSRASGDSFLLDPVFFLGRTHVVVFAEEATEEFSSNRVFEYTNGEFRELGDLKVARRVPFSGGGINDIVFCNPMNNATVTFRESDQTYSVQLRTNDAQLVLDPDTAQQSLVKTRNGTATFRYNGQKFVQVSPEVVGEKSRSH